MKPSFKKLRVLPLTIHSLRPLLADALPQVGGASAGGHDCYKVTIGGCPCNTSVTH